MSSLRHLPAERPTVLSFRGPDCVRYLNGQLTRDVRDLGDRALLSCVTDAKGRLEYLVHVCAGPATDSLWVFGTPAHTGGLRDRLERYLIADEVEVFDESGAWDMIHSESLPPSPEPAFVRRRRGLFGDGYDLWWKAGEAPDWHPLDADSSESLRIAAMQPAWEKELTAGMLPPEAGLDRTAIDYRKGCFIGQEVLSRIKSIGRVNRRLAGLRIDGTAVPGDRLVFGEKDVGQLTSVASSAAPDGRCAALGYLGKAAYEQGDFEVRTSAGESRGTAERVGWA